MGKVFHRVMTLDETETKKYEREQHTHGKIVVRIEKSI